MPVNSTDISFLLGKLTWASNELDRLILSTPTSELRNTLTDANVAVGMAQDALRQSLEQLRKQYGARQS